MRLIDADALCEDLMRRWSVAETRKDELIKAVMADIVTPIVVSQPTIEPERHGRWIPCSERLPEIIKGHYVSDVCIVYCDTGAYGFTILEENIFGQVGWQCERDDDYHEPLGEVIAWMELPEPYRKGEQE